jgi:hypothetical protein
MGRGVFKPKSSKKKLNTKSSTEAELVGASDYLPNTIWAKHFMEAQGYDIAENTFYQDNQSAIRLEKNGRASAGQKSRHINIRYFFIKDRIKSDDMKVIHCPTEQMLADFYTKPLQGALFRKFRAVILGQEPIGYLDYYTTALPPVEERVGNERPEAEVAAAEDVGPVESVSKPTESEDTAAWNLVGRYGKLTHASPENEPIKRTNKSRVKWDDRGVSHHSYFENNPIVVKV